MQLGISAYHVLLCQLFQESLLPLIIIAGSSILGLMRFTPITVARLSTLILLTLEFNCISCRNLPESKGKYFKSEKEDCKKPYTPTGIKSWLIHPALPLNPKDRNMKLPYKCKLELGLIGISRKTTMWWAAHLKKPNNQKGRENLHLISNQRKTT